ncbi:phosphoglycerate mutase [Streptococcus pneumoniae]|nr:phosphoglycerate mutase [Streptococcus pneumoniae]
MKLYFVRHGRTLWNQEGRFQGASGDSPLLPESIETLKRLGQYLKEIPFDQIFIQVIYLERSNLLRLSKVNSIPPVL